MTIINDHDNLLLIQNITNSDQKNISKLLKEIINKLYEEKEIEEHTSSNKIKSLFHDNFHEYLLCVIPNFLFKLLIEKGIAHIVEPQLLLEIPCYTY